MNITIKLNKDFERKFNELVETYGEDFEALNGFAESQLDYTDFIDNFVDKNNVANASIDPNANVSQKDVKSLTVEQSKPHNKLLAFSKIYYEMKKKYGKQAADSWLEQEWTGGFYLHDAHSASMVHYCYAYDLTRLAKEGLFFLQNYNSRGPEHLTTWFDDVIEYVSYACNRSSGAVGVPNVLVWAFYFYKKDVRDGYIMKSPEYYARQNFQKFIYRLNQPFLRGAEAAFTNVSIFDRPYSESLFGGLEFPDGSFFIDQLEEFIEFEKIFMEVISDVRSENLFTFPVLTYSLLKRKDISEEEKAEMLKTKNFNVFVDQEFARWASDHNRTWNDSNFFLSDSVGALSNCCRLISDTSLLGDTQKLNGFMNSIGGTALSIGSEKVNTINLMRVALESEGDQDRFEAILTERTTLCCKVLDVIRHIIERNIEKGLLPNFCEGGVEMDHLYSTVGILGMYEAVKYFGGIEFDEFGNAFYTDRGVQFAQRVFNIIDKVKDNFPCNFTFNVESVPGEKAAVTLCQKDKRLFIDKVDDDIYSNQWIPLSQKTTIQEKLRVSAVLDPMAGGGAISHVNLESNFPTDDAAWEMLNKVALTGVIYFAFNTKINICKHNHGFVGTDVCPICGEPVYDTAQRVVGFITPTHSYSKSRFKEFNTRKWFSYLNDLKEF